METYIRNNFASIADSGITLSRHPIPRKVQEFSKASRPAYFFDCASIFRSVPIMMQQSEISIIKYQPSTNTELSADEGSVPV